MRQALKARGLTHQQFAARIGYQTSYVSALCGRGERKIPEKAARFFSLTLAAVAATGGEQQ